MILLPLPCPFCGEGSDRIYTGADEYERPFFYCRTCFAQTSSRVDRTSALKLWNDRTAKTILSPEIGSFENFEFAQEIVAFFFDKGVQYRVTYKKEKIEKVE